MEQKYGLSYVAELKNELIAAKENGLLTRDVTAERQQNQRIIEETELPKKTPERWMRKEILFWKKQSWKIRRIR